MKPVCCLYEICKSELVDSPGMLARKRFLNIIDIASTDHPLQCEVQYGEMKLQLRLRNVKKSEGILRPVFDSVLHARSNSTVIKYVLMDILQVFLA